MNMAPGAEDKNLENDIVIVMGKKRTSGSS